MKLVLRLLVIFLTLLFAFQSTLRPAMAYYTNMPASIVIGQSDFTSNSANQGRSAGSNTMSAPYSVYFDGTRLFVADRDNHRVLIFNQIPTSNGQAADVVIGQADFSSNSANQGGSVGVDTLSLPIGVATDGTRLFVADKGNHRVLIYDTIPTSNNASADVVIGQADFTSGSANQGGSVGANTLNTVTSAFIDGTKLFIADFGNSRVLIYDTIPTSNNASADVVIGQADFTSGSANQGGSVGANTLNNAGGAFAYGNRLFISDYANSRVLIYNSIPTSNNASADVVIGQADFTGNTFNQGGSVGANTMSFPFGVFFDGTRLFISEISNHRFLIYNQIPTSNNTPADVVIGQPDFTSNTINQGGSVGANTIRWATSSYVYGTRMFVTDRGNHRVLIFNNIIATPGLEIDTPFESLPEGRLRVRGNILLGERSRYSMQRVQAEVNGQGLSEVTSLGSGRDEESGVTRYDFHHDFEPWAGISAKDQYDQSTGYTLKLIASSFNADDSELFFFLPFALNSVTQQGSSAPIFNFSVNKDQIQRIKDNISHFEIWVKKTSDDSQQMSVDREWTKYIGNISTSKISSDGKVVTSNSNSLSKGNYQVKVKSISKNSHWEQDSNTITTSFEGTTFNNPLNLPISTTWFPLQINSITGVNTGVISTTNVGGIQTNYTTSTTTPTISGIAFAGSEVTLTVTNQSTERLAR